MYLLCRVRATLVHALDHLHVHPKKKRIVRVEIRGRGAVIISAEHEPLVLVSARVSFIFLSIEILEKIPSLKADPWDFIFINSLIFGGG